MRFDREVALVTGGGSGLGAATARALSNAGVKVGILDRNAGGALTVADEIGGVGIAADVTSVDDYPDGVSS